MGRQVLRACAANPVQLDHLAPKAHVANPVQLDRQDQLDHPARKVGHLVPQARPAHKGPKAHKVLQVSRALKELKVL